MEDTITVKLQALTAAAFRPYGQVLEGRHLVYPDTEEGRVAIEILHLPYRPAKPFEQMAIHFSYNQTFIQLTGALALVVAPPPRNRDAHGADVQQYEFDYEQAAAFVLEPGQGAFIDKGTWHNVRALSEDCAFVNVTRKNAGEAISAVEDFQTYVESSKVVRPYLEFVNLRKRDHRIINVTE